MVLSPNYIEQLKQFINKEQDNQNAEVKKLWLKPIGTRVSEGEAIDQVLIQNVSLNRMVVECPNNLSKFRQGDQLKLTKNEPQAGHFVCEVITEDGNQMVLQAGYGENFVGIKPRTMWTLDRNIVDVRHILLAALETIKFNQELNSFFYDFLSGQHTPKFDEERLDKGSEKASDNGFNPSQISAFSKAYATNNYYIIQGPPGTGKTKVLAHLAEVLAKEGQRVLITAFTHRAINNALYKIASDTDAPNVYKVGQSYNADGLEKNGICVQNAEYLDDIPADKHSNSIIIGGTCYAVRTKRLQDMPFDTVIFDEAGQVTIPLAMAGMMAGRKHIFIGDHCQMPPVITTDHQNEWVSKSIFELLFNKYPGTMLDVTYRMNETINQFPSKHFYMGGLKPFSEIANKRLVLKRSPRKFPQILDPSHPDVFVEIPHMNRGMRSPEEAALAAELVIEAMDCGLPANEIAVIAPYRAQGRLIRNNLFSYKQEGFPIDQIVVDTGERIQGQERDVIIISLTTSDPAHAENRAEFFFQPNRLNVSITRPRVKRIILGSPLLFRTNPKEESLKRNVELFYELYKQCHKVRIRY